MELFIPLLAALHTLGAGIGACGITFAELMYLKAAADGTIDDRERAYIRTAFWALRTGLVAVLLSGIALTLVQYQYPALPQAVLAPALWMQNTLAFVVILAGWALASKRLPWLAATALSFSAWWMIFALDAWRAQTLGYAALALLYTVAAFAAAGLLAYLRMLAGEKERASAE